MNALLTLTRREITERRPLLWGTLVAAVIPLLARLQPWLRPEVRRDWHEGLAFIFGITFPIALAIGLGASIVGEDLAQRRLGFYFSRPVSGWAVWASKNLAAILITLGTGLAFVLPVALLSDGRPSVVISDLMRKFPEWFLPWIVLLVGLMFVAQAVAGAYRARDGLFALDIVAFAVLVSVGAGLVWRLHVAGMALFSPELGPAAPAHFLVAPAMRVIAVAAAVAAAAQVIVGRTDARRGHLALSTTLWGILALGLATAAGFISWVLSVAPQDVGVYPWSLHATPSASHLLFWGARNRAGYQPIFLLDTATGLFDRLPRNRMLGFSFSADGRRVLWIEGGEGELPELVLRKLDAPGSSAIRSSLSRYAGFNPLLGDLSDDGRLAVLSMQGRIAVVDTDSGREAASASSDQLGLDPRSALQRSRHAFVGATAVMGFFSAPPNTGLPLVVTTFDFRTGRVTAGPKVAGIEEIRSVRDGRALLSARNGPLAVVDGLAVHELVPAASSVVLGSAILLDEGRTAAFVKRGGDPRLLVWNREGRPTLDVPFPEGSSIVTGEPRAGWLALGPGLDYSKPPRTVFVDSTTGAVVRVEEGLTPAGPWYEGQNLPAGSPGSRLFVGTKGEIVRLDPDTGRRETILVSNAPEDARNR